MDYGLQEYYHMGADEFRPDDTVSAKVVAVIGWGGDWAAYRGPADWEDSEVANQGDKISAEGARGLFPGLAGLRYRGA